VCFDASVRVRARVVEERSKAPEPVDLDIHPSPVRTQNIQERRAVILEHTTDVREREAEVPQRTDAVQACHVVLVVNALLTKGPRRGPEQPDVLVVVERAHGQAGRLRQLSDAPASIRRSFLHRGDDTT
jgi:hypothetical protein